MKTLTTRQQEVLDFIGKFISEHTYPPTIREIAEHFSISVKGAYDHVKALQRKGQILISENRSRTLEIVHSEKPVDSSVVELPLLGVVAAGKPILAEGNGTDTILVPANFARGDNCFALKVRGDSMKNAGILDGDIAIIEKKPTAENGEIVVALIDESATLKRFYRENNRIKLAPENPDYTPIYSQDVKILGCLKGIMRKY